MAKTSREPGLNRGGADGMLKQMSELVRQRPWDRACVGFAGTRRPDRTLRSHPLRAVGLVAAGVLIWALSGPSSGSAAAAGYTVMLNAPMPLLGASRPAPAPATPDFKPAPTPDVDASKPPDVRLRPGQPQWGATLEQTPTHALRPGAGGATGSNFSEELQRRRGGVGDGLTPMLNLKMPLQ
jgi:hypothetical protein